MCADEEGRVCPDSAEALTDLLLVTSDGFLGSQRCWINFILPVSDQQSYYLDPTLLVT